jgi:hypothetical protein
LHDSVTVKDIAMKKQANGFWILSVLLRRHAKFSKESPGEPFMSGENKIKGNVNDFGFIVPEALSRQGQTKGPYVLKRRFSSHFCEKP